MTKKVITGLMIIFAYVIPLAVGLSVRVPYAAWLFVPLVLSIWIWASGKFFQEIWTGVFLLLLGIIIAVMVGTTANGWILCASIAILIIHFILDNSKVFDE